MVGVNESGVVGSCMLVKQTRLACPLARLGRQAVTPIHPPTHPPTHRPIPPSLPTYIEGQRGVAHEERAPGHPGEDVLVRVRVALQLRLRLPQQGLDLAVVVVGGWWWRGAGGEERSRRRSRAVALKGGWGLDAAQRDEGAYTYPPPTYSYTDPHIKKN